MTDLLKPVGTVKGAPVFSKNKVAKYVEHDINNESYFNQSVDTTKSDSEKAIEKLNNVDKNFLLALDKYVNTVRRLEDVSKKASGSVRDSANKLADGLLKIEKAANFSRLETYVLLLERAANALTTLAELDKAGKLSKISSALK